MSTSLDGINRQSAISQLFGANGSQNAASPFSNLNLTAQQQSQLKNILQGASSGNVSPAQIRSQIDSVLSSSQQTTLHNDLKSLKAHHRHGAHASSASSSSIDSDTDAFGVPNTTTGSTATPSAITPTPTQSQDPFSSIAAAFAALQQLTPAQVAT